MIYEKKATDSTEKTKSALIDGQLAERARSQFEWWKRVWCLCNQ